MAQRNSSAVKLANADVLRAESLLKQSKDVYIPNLVVGSSVGPPSIGFTFSQPSIANATVQSLFFSYPQKQYILAAQEGVHGAALNLKDAKEQAALDASADYIELDTVSRELETAQQQSEFADRLLLIEQQRQEAGVDPLSEVLQARLIVAQLKLRVTHLQSRASTLLSQLASLTGLPAASIRTLHSSIPEVPALTAEQPAGSDPLVLAGVQAARAQAASRQFQAKGDYLSAKHWPLIAFGAQYNRDATSLNNYNTYFSAKRKFKADNFNAGFNIQIPIYDRSKKDKSRETAAESLRATVEAEQAQRQNDVQIATLSANLRELSALAEVASLKQQIATEQVKTVRTSLESGNGAGTDPGAPPQQSPKAEQQALIDERQKTIDALDTGFDLTKARLGLLRALGHMDDWLREVGPAEAAGAAPVAPVTN
jgi:outer membrane protein TolC